MMMDQHNMGRYVPSTPVVQLDGVGTSSPIDGETTRRPSLVPTTQPLHTRDDDTPHTSMISLFAEEAAFSGDSCHSKISAGGPGERQETAAHIFLPRLAEEVAQKDAEPEPPHAPDEERPLLCPAPPMPPPQHSSIDNQGSTKCITHTKPGRPSESIEEINTRQPAAADKDAARGDSMPPLPPDELPPELIEFYNNPDDDSYGLRSFLEAITNPQLLVRIQYGLRTILLVTFPLFTISLHPNTRYRLGFPPLLIASVVSTSTHRPTVGEQIGMHSWTWRGIIYMLIWGSAVDAWGVAYHVGAWYGLLATGIFGAGLVNNGNMRRFMFLYFFLYMLELRTHVHYFSSVPLNDAAFSAADYLIGSLMGVAADIIPFPCLISDTVDKCLTKIFGGFGKLLFDMIDYIWSPDVHAAVFFFDNRIPFITIEAVLSQMPSLLWYASWEPMEFPLRNPTRRVKLSLMRRIMALGYAAFSCGRMIASLRQQQADRIATHQIRCCLYQSMRYNAAKAIEDVKPPLTGHSSGPLRSGNDDDPVTEAARKGANESIAALRANSHIYVKNFSTVLRQATALIGSTESTPEQLIKKVPFDTLREKQTLMRHNLRLELLQVMKIQSEMVIRQRAREQKRKHSTALEEDEGESEGVDSVCREPADRFEFKEADARLVLEHRAVIDSCDVFLRINYIFFHLLIVMIAGEILNFGEQMKEYKPTESLFCRWWKHYIVEAWDGFWSELWCRITLARPTDYRNIKDAIRMTCAYVSAVVLSVELWNPLNGLYFFGVTPLMGLPLEEESLGMGICRIAGNTMGCALGYMAYHNTNNFAQQIAMTLCFAFVQRCCQYHAQYGQFFFYGTVITLAGLATAMIFNELVVRLIASSYTVMAYLMCCMFIFPNDCRKICFNYRCKLTKVVSETIDDVALTARLPIEFNDDADDNRNSNEPMTYPKRNTEPMQVCSQLNVELMLIERLQMMCDKWAPFAARDLVIRGEAEFPAGPNSVITRAHDRLVANTRLLVFGVQLLHRPRSAPPSPSIAYFIHHTLADFLDDFADAVRLVGMDHVQALQRSRTWSYARHLSRVSQLRRLRVRLHVVMHECYVVVGNKVSKGTFCMTPEDFAQMRREGAGQRRLVAAPGSGGKSEPTPSRNGSDSCVGSHREELHGHDDVYVPPDADDNRVDGVAPPSPHDETRQNRGCPALEEHIEVIAGEEDGNRRMSFVDRYLAARKDEELTEGPENSRRFSLTTATAPEEPLVLDDAGNQQRDRSQQQQRSSFPTPYQSDLEMSFSTQTPIPGRRRSSIYVHRAHLQQSPAEPADAWPLTVGSAERDVAKLLNDERKRLAKVEQDHTRRHSRQQIAGPCTDAIAPPSPPSQSSSDALSRTRRNLSRLILLPDKEPVVSPLYKGPSFTFVEGELDTPADTDFSAITTILLSCESIMTEFESQSGSLNSLTNYNKQLHETSIATTFLDKWSTKLTEYRKGIYDRYHFRKPPPQKRGPIHTQEDPFEDWKF